MKKIIFIILLSIISPIFCQQSDGPYFVSPPPPFCSENETEKQCAATACAMVMEYWNRREILIEKHCKGFAEEFCSQNGFNENGGAHPDAFLYKYALINVAKNSLIDENMDIYAQFIDASFFASSYGDIKKNMKYANENDEDSPWDRVGVFIFPYNKKNKNFKIAHAILGWGCEKNKKGQIYYYYKDPIWKVNSNYQNKFCLEDNPGCNFIYLYPVKCE